MSPPVRPDTAGEPLSVRAAAIEAGNSPALIMIDEAGGAETWGFADLAAAAAEAPIAGGVRVARADLDTCVAIHAHLETGEPLALIHARATETERAALSPPDFGPGAALAVYTSGTTGTPRPVILSRRALIASATASAANLGWQPGDRWLCPLPLAHVGGLSILIRCLIARRAMVSFPGPFEAARLHAAIAEHEVTLLSVVPTMLADLVSTGVRAPASLRAVLVGGAAASRPLLERACALGYPVLRTYGLSEAGSQVCTQPYATRGTVRETVGPPLPGITVRIGPGDRILVGGPTLAEGVADRRGWLRTGDRGALDENGELLVFGRSDDVIITGGENVDPLEVEGALLAHTAVRAACVFGIADERWGQLVCAALVLDDPEADAREIVAEIAPRLASFKRPRRVAVVETLPLGDTGKVDRAAVARVAAARLEEVDGASTR